MNTSKILKKAIKLFKQYLDCGCHDDRAGTAVSCETLRKYGYELSHAEMGAIVWACEDHPRGNEIAKYIEGQS